MEKFWLTPEIIEYYLKSDFRTSAEHEMEKNNIFVYSI